MKPSTLKFPSNNPRSIVGASTNPPIFFWIEDGADQKTQQPYERIVGLRLDAQLSFEIARSSSGFGPLQCLVIENEIFLACPIQKSGRFGIELFRLSSDGKLKSTKRIAETPSIFGPLSLCSTNTELHLCWLSRKNTGTTIELAKISPDFDEVSFDSLAVANPREPKIISESNKIWIAWIEAHRNQPKIWLKPLGEAHQIFCVHRSENAHIGGLDLSTDQNGRIWIAFHTDHRPGRTPDLTRWIDLRCFDRGKVVIPQSRQHPKGWGKLGEDQGYEFPRLVTGVSGKMGMLTRSSHRHWISQLGQNGWSEPIAIDDEGWGCRSLNVATTRQKSETLAAFRERNDVVIRPIELEDSKGSPRFRSPSCSLPSKKSLRSKRPQRRGRYLVCFGDIHQHTALSDGTGSVREAYERVRDSYRDDFTSVTDHESFLGKRVGNGKWHDLLIECDHHNDPGRFVTIPGFEWTGKRYPGPGHKCVYWPTSDGLLLGRELPESSESKNLIEAVKTQGGLVFPHHVGWTGADEEAHDPEVQTCWEVFSCHGSYEALREGPIGQRDVPLEGQFIRDQLDRGLKFGFVGGSDGHGLLWHHGVSRKRDSHRTGLTAVFVEELTREAVFQALKNRHCYATSGVPILIEFRVNNAVMGQTIQTRGKIRIEAFADCPTSIRKADLVWEGGTCTELFFQGSSLNVQKDLEKALGRYVYLRVELVDSEIALSSPIWIF